MNVEGIGLAQSPNPRNFPGKSYRFRDYFIGAGELFANPGGASAYISRVYESETDGKYKFGVSAPIVGDDGELDGVLVGAITTASTLGSLLPKDSQQRAVLVGKWDKNLRPGVPDPDEPPPDNLILRHPAYETGIDPIGGFSEAQLSEAKEHSNDYEDPVREHYHQYEGRWIAGFAPVQVADQIKFHVIVQQHYDEAVEPYKILARSVILWGGGTLTIVVTLVIATVGHWLQRLRVPSPQHHQ